MSQPTRNSHMRSVDSSNSIMLGYQKIKTVGQGSFGTANLYKRRADDVLVVMKHIHISEMVTNERNMALNEVQVISSLHNENIIKYLGSFETHTSFVIIMEYANGGNLAQLISLKKNNDDPIAENSVLNIFSQICNGIGYMHSHKILHRDLKSANIFLTRDGIVKIGDFGISKMMTSRSGAQTVVGTPYYLSPEMCEGKDYNEKSDIWSMGCILYELICLRKPFEGSTLPALVHKIISVQYADIPQNYSDGLHRLVQMILQKDFNKRPSAEYMYQTIIPAIYESLLDAADYSHNLSISNIFTRSIPKDRSVLYELYGFTSEPNLYPVKLPHKQIIDFSNSGTHFIVLTLDRRVYSWGADTCGQLGHGKTGDARKYPSYVDFFRGKNIVRCFAGESFSLFLTEFGAIFTCGEGKDGCLGHGDWNNNAIPTIINSLSTLNISTLSCGAFHVIALSSSGIVYAWGSSKEGQLGLGSTNPCCKPTKTDTPTDINIKEVYAGSDNSAFLTTNGQLFVAGSNMNNKLGLGTLPYCTSFVSLAGLNERIKDVSLGIKHSVLLTEDGEVLCMGSNQDYQCGPGQFIGGILRVQQLPKIEMITAGTCYTVAGSVDNVLYFWGTHSLRNKKSRTLNETYTNTFNSNSSNARLLPHRHLPLPFQDNVSSEFTELEIRFRQLKSDIQDGTTNAVLPVVQIHPTSILALYASPEEISKSRYVWLARISANDNSVSVLVHTTTPPPIRKVEEDSEGQALLMNWNRSNRIYRNQSLPNTPQST